MIVASDGHLGARPLEVVGDGDLAIGRLAGNDDHGQAEGLDQCGIVGRTTVVGMRRTQDVGAKRLWGLHRDE